MRIIANSKHLQANIRAELFSIHIGLPCATKRAFLQLRVLGGDDAEVRAE